MGAKVLSIIGGAMAGLSFSNTGLITSIPAIAYGAIANSPIVLYSGVGIFVSSLVKKLCFKDSMFELSADQKTFNKKYAHDLTVPKYVKTMLGVMKSSPCNRQLTIHNFWQIRIHNNWQQECTV
jgi:hypothetical protein